MIEWLLDILHAMHNPGSPRVHRADVKLTQYKTINMDDYAPEGLMNIPVRDGERTMLLAAPRQFVDDLRLEGMGKTRSGMIGYDARGFTLMDAKVFPWGAGVSDLPLVPYLTCATDPKVIPTGSRLSIPVLSGLSMPDGTIHPGILTAVDTGAAIKGWHIDWFVGDATSYQKTNAMMTALGHDGDKTIDRSKRVTVTWVEPDATPS